MVGHREQYSRGHLQQVLNGRTRSATARPPFLGGGVGDGNSPAIPLSLPLAWSDQIQQALDRFQELSLSIHAQKIPRGLIPPEGVLLTFTKLSEIIAFLVWIHLEVISLFLFPPPPLYLSSVNSWNSTNSGSDLIVSHWSRRGRAYRKHREAFSARRRW